MAKKAENAENVKNIAGRKALIASLKEELSARLALMASNPAVWIAGIAAVSIGLIALQEKFNKSLDECTEELSNNNSEFQNAQSTVDSLESELKTCRDRLEELQKLSDEGTISVIEQEEYERLKNTNDELERNLKIEKEKAKLSAIEGAKTADETLTKRVQSQYIRGSVESYEGVVLENQIMSVLPEEELNAAINEYQRLQTEIDNLNASYDKGEISVSEYESQLEDLKNQQIDSENRASEMNDILEECKQSYKNLEDTGGDFTRTQKDNYAIVEESSKKYNDFIDSINGVETSVEKLNDTEENLVVNEPKIFNPTSFSESIQQLSSLQKLYDEFYNNVKDGVDFTFDISDIESLREKFGEVCQSFDEFEKLATSSSTSAEQLQNGFDQLASEFIICSGALNGLDESTRQQIVSQLELQGLMNTSSIITEEVATVIGNASDQNLSLADASDEAYLSLLDEANASETTRMTIYALATAEIAYNNTGLNTKDKIAQLQELASAYGDTASAALAASAAQYAESMSAFHGGSYKDALEYKYNELLNSMNKFSGVQFEISQSAENANKSASKAGKDSADAYVEAYEKELEKLKDLKENGLISEKEYLDRSRVLYEKYFKGIDKYAKNFADAQREYLKGILDYHNKAISAVGSVIDKRTKELEKQKDAEVKGYNDQIKYLDELVKSLDVQIDAKQKEIQAINDAADARKKELDIQKAQYEFLKAQQQRTSLLYKGGQMVYEQDTTNVRDKKTELEDAEREYRISQLEKEKELIEQQKDAYEKQSESLEEMIDKTEEYFDNLIESLNNYKDRWDELSDIQSQAESLAVLKELGYTTEDILAMSDSAFETFKSDYLSILADMNSGNDGFLESLAKLGNVEGISGLGSYLEKTQSQIDTLAATNFATLENEFSKVGSSVSDTKDKVSELSGQIDGGGGEKSESNAYAGNGDPLAGGGKKGESSSLKSSIENETETALSGFGEQADELNNNVSPAISKAKDEMDSFNDSAGKPIEKTINITYSVNKKSSSSDIGKYAGKAKAEGTVGNAFASGTGKYKGLAHDEKNALRSEYGQPELTVYPDGKYEITNEPVISDLPKDTVIFNEEQTKKILSNKGSGNVVENFIGSTFRNGTVLKRPEHSILDDTEEMKAFWLSNQIMQEILQPISNVNKNVEMMASNVSKINNNNRQIVNTIQNVNVNCPGVSSQEVAQQIGTELQKTFSGMALNAYQKMNVTR